MSAIENDAKAIEGIGDSYKYGFHDDEKPVIKVERGLTEDIIRQISAHKAEPEWMLDYRLKSY
jgi:Fe-S cluster assembly protein SufB